MAFNFASAGPAGQTVTSPPSKPIQVKAVKLLFSDFTTGGTAAVKAVLPPDASIVGLRYWVKTTFSGNSVSAMTLSVGVSGAATRYVSAGSFALTAGTYGVGFNGAAGGLFADADPAN